MGAPRSQLHARGQVTSQLGRHPAGSAARGRGPAGELLAATEDANEGSGSCRRRCRHPAPTRRTRRRRHRADAQPHHCLHSRRISLLGRPNASWPLPRGVIDHARPPRRTDTAMIGIVDLQRCADHGGGGVGAPAPLPAAARGSMTRPTSGASGPQRQGRWPRITDIRPARAPPAQRVASRAGQFACDQVHLGPLQG
jgi:hypothetical protein